jgi:hypothetical protein
MMFLDDKVIAALAVAGVVLKDRAKSALYTQCQFAERRGKELTSPAQPKDGLPYAVFHRLDQGQIPPISHWLMVTDKTGRELKINLHTAETTVENKSLIRFSVPPTIMPDIIEESQPKYQCALRK